MTSPVPEPDRQLAAIAATAQLRPAAYAEPPAVYARELEELGPGGLLDYWRVLCRRKGVVLLCAFLGVLAAVAFTLPQSPVYQAHASLEIQNRNQEFLNLKQLSPVAEGVTDYWSNDIQTHIKLLSSEALLNRVTARVGNTVPDAPQQNPGRVSAWRRALNLPEPKTLNPRQGALDVARGSLKIRAAGQTRVVEITAESTDARIAAEFVNSLAAEYIDQTMEARWQMNQRTSQWLNRQLDEMRIKLEHSEDELQKYARRAGLLFTGEGDRGQQNVSEQKLRQLQEELSKAQADRIAKQSRNEMAQSSPADSLADVLNDSALREYQSKLTDLRRQQADLSATYQPGYSKVTRIQAQIAALENALGRERKSILQRIRNDYLEATRRENLLAASYASQAKLVTTESEKSIQYNILKREVDSTRQLYEGMLQRMKEAGVASAMQASNIRVVDQAEQPTVPVKPRLSVNGALGLLVGLFMGVVVAILRERTDRTLQAPGDTPFYLRCRELGVIPDASSSRVLRIVYRPSRKRVAATVAASGTDASAASEPVVKPVDAPSSIPRRADLVTKRRKDSAISEAYRVALTSILFSGENGARPRVVVLTSAGAGEGKTTAISNLAITASEIRHKVLLIDADMRRPGLHEVFQLPNDRGLSDLLQATPANIRQTMHGIVQQTTLPRLYLLPAGPAAATDTLYSPMLPALLKRFSKDFDMILIDTPPVLQMPDARVLARQADATVLVVKSGETTRDAAMAAAERLTADGARILGTILNKWNPKKSPKGHYAQASGYGYYHEYAGHYSTVKKEE